MLVETVATDNGHLVGGCATCQGTGIISRWTEIAYFEDRRYCPDCAKGHEVESRMKEIVTRFEADEQEPPRV